MYGNVEADWHCKQYLPECFWVSLRRTHYWPLLNHQFSNPVFSISDGFLVGGGRAGWSCTTLCATSRLLVRFFLFSCFGFCFLFFFKIYIFVYLLLVLYLVVNCGIEWFIVNLAVAVFKNHILTETWARADCFIKLIMNVKSTYFQDHLPSELNLYYRPIFFKIKLGQPLCYTYYKI